MGKTKQAKGRKNQPRCLCVGRPGAGLLPRPPAPRFHSPSLSPQEQKGSKKKELRKDLRQDPPVLRVLGSGPVDLEPLLSGEPFVSTVCNFGVVRTLETDRLTLYRVQQCPWPPLPTEAWPGCGREGEAGRGRGARTTGGGAGGVTQQGSPAWWAAFSSTRGQASGQVGQLLPRRPGEALAGVRAPTLSPASPHSSKELILWFFLSGFKEEEE